MSFKSAPPSLDDDPSANSSRPILTTCIWLLIWSAGLIALVFFAGERLNVSEDSPQANSQADSRVDAEVNLEAGSQVDAKANPLDNSEAGSQVDAKANPLDNSEAGSQVDAKANPLDNSEAGSQVDAKANPLDNSEAGSQVDAMANRVQPGESQPGGDSASPVDTEASSASQESDAVIEVPASTKAQSSSDNTATERPEPKAEPGKKPEPEPLAETERKPEVEAEVEIRPGLEAEPELQAQAKPELEAEPEPVESSEIFIDDGEVVPENVATESGNPTSEDASTVVAELPADIPAQVELEAEGSDKRAESTGNSPDEQDDDSSAIDPADEVIAVQKKFDALSQNRVNFYSASTELTAQSQQVLDELAQLMKNHKTVNLDIQGHSDITGFALANLYLSQTRAGSVRDYLVDKGISQFRMLPRGFGESEPIADNSTSAGRALNRRIEFRFLEENQWN